MPTASEPGSTPRRALVRFYAAFVGIALLTRIALLLKSADELSWDGSLVAAFGLGLAYDVGAAALASLPLVAAHMVLPGRVLRHRWTAWGGSAALFVLSYSLLFGAVAEWTFWDEFGARFNFIAVDYLVYTNEVLGNIRESYPLPWILAALLPAAALLWWALARARWSWHERLSIRRRWLAGALSFGAPLTLGLVLSEDRLPSFENTYNREIAKNGYWSLFAAFKNNVLDYDQFYRTMPPELAFARLREELVEDHSILLRPDEMDTLRYVKNPGTELRPNVIQITVESLSAKFLGTFHPGSTLTPGLDEIASRSLVFENFYATGTRTDRGIEALTLSLPPTPGRSMVKRPHNENLFTLGPLFRARGYETAFLYGGFGYFDNMNHFFASNGYRVVDRSSVAADDITFANVWGACDEDLYRWTLREADASHAAGQPFHYFVLTTSNHRPYTYPDGRIDLPSKTSGRAGAVKYTDYAIRAFLSEAASRPWFRDTVFVIVADHCASSAGRSAIPVENHHIPLLVYAPGGQIAPGRISTLMSQMDYAPTLLGLLNWSYPSRFFGHDVRRIDTDEAHALVGNYQRLGHLEKGSFVVLGPCRDVQNFHFDSASHTLTPSGPDAYAERESIAFYQTASQLCEHDGYRALTPEQLAYFTEVGEGLVRGGQASAGTAR